jgi:hypothetical protein
MKTAQQSIKRGVPTCGLLLAATIILLGFSQNASAQWTTATNGNDVYKTNTAGNVGVGTTNPQYGKLQVNKTVRIDDDSGSLTGSDTLGGAPNLYLGTTSGGSAFQFNGSGGIDLWQYNNAAWGRTVTFAKAGNVGIGTTTPTTATGYTALSLNNSTGTLVDFMTGNALKARLQSDGTTFYFNNLANGPIQIYTNSTERMRVDAGGNVGIGTISPQYKLDVLGNINSSETITGNNIVAKYQDVAEWVPSSEQVSAGTVVVLDSTKSNQVVSSSEAYDTRVAGVVSEQPGIALGESGAGKVLVATTGRVIVKVDASRGSIHIGDLLVTSDVPGVAMKSEPVKVGSRMMHLPGTLIGKALEPLEKGSGKILVLLSLQ